MSPLVTVITEISWHPWCIQTEIATTIYIITNVPPRKNGMKTLYSTTVYEMYLQAMSALSASVRRYSWVMGPFVLSSRVQCRCLTINGVIFILSEQFPIHAEQRAARWGMRQHSRDTTAVDIRNAWSAEILWMWLYPLVEVPFNRGPLGHRYLTRLFPLLWGIGSVFG